MQSIKLYISFILSGLLEDLTVPINTNTLKKQNATPTFERKKIGAQLKFGKLLVSYLQCGSKIPKRIFVVTERKIVKITSFKSTKMLYSSDQI